MLFVLVRVLRVPESNPIVWQLSLIDRELDEVLRCAEVRFRSPGAAPGGMPVPCIQHGSIEVAFAAAGTPGAEQGAPRCGRRDARRAGARAGGGGAPHDRAGRELPHLL